jgi:hypothetical protein
MLDERDAAWAEVYAVLPADWVVLRPMWRGEQGAWAVYARSTARSSDAESWVEAFGETEAIALRALAQQLRTGQTSACRPQCRAPWVRERR